MINYGNIIKRGNFIEHPIHISGTIGLIWEMICMLDSPFIKEDKILKKREK